MEISISDRVERRDKSQKGLGENRTHALATALIQLMVERELRIRAAALAGSLLSLTRWWIDGGGKQPPNEMDELFHRMVWVGMNSECGPTAKLMRATAMLKQ
jgi:hypothetical protein